MSFKTIQVNTVLRAVIVVAALLACWATYFAIKWSFGNTLAKQVDALSQAPVAINPAEIKEVAQLSVDMAPSDPQAHYALAFLHEKSFLPQDLPKALAGFETAVSVSPYDYRLWLNLGKVRERSGDSAGAEKAFQKALELAPNYSEPHWVIGNYFLRNGRMDEAFAEIRKAAESNPDYANPAVVTAWQIFDGDTTQIAQKIGDSIPIKAGLAPFLAKQKRFDDAFTFWNSIPDQEKATEYKRNGEDLIGAFLDTKNYRYALTIQNQIAAPEAEKFAIGSLYNGGFEKEVKTSNVSAFDWKLDDGNQPQISLDGSQKQEGERSLIILFNSQTGQENRSIQQTIAVESGKSYKFEAFYRADLKAFSTMRWEILDILDNKVLAATEAIQTSANWTPLTVDFTTPSNTQAVIIRLNKVPCKQGLCPISGKVWFDNLSLK